MKLKLLLAFLLFPLLAFGANTNVFDNVLIRNSFQFIGGTPGPGKVLTSDGFGYTSWTTPAAGGAQTNAVNNWTADQIFVTSATGLQPHGMIVTNTTANATGGFGGKAGTSTMILNNNGHYTEVALGSAGLTQLTFDGIDALRALGSIETLGLGMTNIIFGSSATTITISGNIDSSGMNTWSGPNIFTSAATGIANNKFTVTNSSNGGYMNVYASDANNMDLLLAKGSSSFQAEVNSITAQILLGGRDMMTSQAASGDTTFGAGANMLTLGASGGTVTIGPASSTALVINSATAAIPNNLVVGSVFKIFNGQGITVNSTNNLALHNREIINNTLSSISSNTVMRVSAEAVTDVLLDLQMFSGQTANPFNIKTATGGNMFSVQSDGPRCFTNWQRTTTFPGFNVVTTNGSGRVNVKAIIALSPSIADEAQVVLTSYSQTGASYRTNSIVKVPANNLGEHIVDMSGFIDPSYIYVFSNVSPGTATVTIKAYNNVGF